MAGSGFAALKQRLAEVHALQKACDLMEWDQLVCMPRGGMEARAELFARLRTMAHERFVCDETGDLLAKAADGYSYDSDEAALLRWGEREYALKRKLPADLVEALARETSRGQEVWVEARSKSDFALFRPVLETIVSLKRRQAEALGGEDPYDAWLGEHEPGMTTAEVERLFSELKSALVPLVRAVAAKPGAVDDSVLRQKYPVESQRLFGTEMAAAIGYDFSRGRLDVSAHPFSLAFAPGDSRITTRYEERWPSAALFGTLHEAGHAMYEQGIAAALEGTPLCSGATMGLHESQSRLWENVIGRGRPFWRRHYARFQELFPAQTRGVDAEGFYRAVNAARPTLIRVEADELTYSLHILLRFELERALLSGSLAVRDLPGAWAEKTRASLGLTPPDDARGVLQDIHWSAGSFGYFPTYALGNMIGLQLFEAAAKEDARVAEGDCPALLAWLRERVHRHGRKFTAPEIVARAAGGPISARPFASYLERKYSELYGL
jgi:carboxypeptidase Taq